MTIDAASIELQSMEPKPRNPTVITVNVRAVSKVKERPIICTFQIHILLITTRAAKPGAAIGR